jgi:DNA topoisomerase-1
VVPKPLVIVESPAKARTISSFLGGSFVVESSVGHIRDLPSSAVEIPAAYKKEPWARLGVNVDDGFKPLYVIPRDKRPVVARLKQALADASELYLATDEDREGESIAWHLLEVLAPKVPVHRMVFHEITPSAIERAVRETRDVDRRLVDAQEARRILDRLYGYELSPLLWRKVMPRLSAGRVQSVATRILVERERARMRFRSANWWDVRAVLAAPEAGQTFPAVLVALDGERLVAGRDFDETGQLRVGTRTSGSPLVLSSEEAEMLAHVLAGALGRVVSVDEKPFKRSPHPPFMTSTLQQEAARKLRFSAQRTMALAQRLYEAGYITYMRTDSVELSETAIEAARREVVRRYGEEFLSREPRRYRSRVRNAQEAHEAIRPAGEVFRAPEEVAGELSSDETRLYELIWRRTIASQMADAEGQSATVRVLVPLPEAARFQSAELVARGRVISFRGFLAAYVAGQEGPDVESEDAESQLPRLAEGNEVRVLEADPEEHATQPPARFTEASLVATLEELGVGRPSTYASIISTIQERGYAWKKGTQLVPSFVAFAVVGLLETYFPELVDYGFTAEMEEALDSIANGRESMVPYLHRFYFGNGVPGLKSSVEARLSEIDAREVNSIQIGVDSDGEAVVVRVGRYGPFLQRGKDRVPLPEDMEPDQLTLDKALSMLAKGPEDRLLGSDPETGQPVFLRRGRFGPYVQLGEAPKDAKSKPKTASLLATMDPDTLSLDEALKLLSLPKSLGLDPATGEEVLVANGPYGPYVRRGQELRSIPPEQDLFSLDLDGALALLAAPRQPRRRAGSADLATLGIDPETGRTVVLRKGRFGPYVTDGEINASLRRGDDPDQVDLERALELLAERRAVLATQPPKSARSRKQGSRRTA